MFKTETVFPLIEICDGLKATTPRSLCSLINVYDEIESIFDTASAFMDTVQLMKSKLLALVPKVAAQQIAGIFAELGLGNVDDVARCSQEQLEHIVKRLYEIIFKFRGVDEKQAGESYRVLIRSPDVRKQVSSQISDAIVKIYESACLALKKCKTSVELYDVEAIKKSLE